MQKMVNGTAEEQVSIEIRLWEIKTL